jgi:hypothetical protein
MLKNTRGGTVTRVFVSYASPDSELAYKVAGWLSSAKMRPRLDREDFEPSANFVLEMSREADKADLTLVLATDKYFRANFTEPEWTVAFIRTLREGSTRLLVARFDDDIGLPTILDPYLWSDLRGLPDDVARARLVTAVERALRGEADAPVAYAAPAPAPTSATPSTPAAAPTPAPQRFRRVVATGGAIAAGGDIDGAVIRNVGTPSGAPFIPDGEGVYAGGGGMAAGGSVRNVEVQSTFAAQETPRTASGAVDNLDLALVAALLEDARRAGEAGDLGWVEALPEPQTAALEGTLADLDTRIRDVQDMVETLWEPAATAQNRTALQRFAKGLPDRAGWEVLKRAVLGVLP